MKVNKDILECVVFVCFPKDGIDPKKGVTFIGTGFIVGFTSKIITEVAYTYLITAKHLAERVKDKLFFIRINNNKGSFEYIECSGLKCFYHLADESIDAAVIPINLSGKVHECIYVHPDCFLTDEIIKQKKIGLGDEVIIAGLFAHACGSQRNQPILRMGNIAMIPDEPLPTDTGDMEAYLIESRSIGGLSGSPAFVVESIFVENPRKIFLLGLMHGHWDIHPEMKNNSDTTYEIGGRVNMGIAIVVPAKKILEILNQPKLVESRENQEKALLKYFRKRK